MLGTTISCSETTDGATEGSSPFFSVKICAMIAGFGFFGARYHRLHTKTRTRRRSKIRVVLVIRHKKVKKRCSVFCKKTMLFTKITRLKILILTMLARGHLVKTNLTYQSKKKSTPIFFFDLQVP